MSFKGLYEDLPPPSSLISNSSSSSSSSPSPSSSSSSSSSSPSSTTTPFSLKTNPSTIPPQKNSTSVVASSPSVLYPYEEKSTVTWSNTSKFIPPTAAALARKKNANAVAKPKKTPKPVVIASASAVVLQPTPPIPPKIQTPMIPAKIASEDIIYDEYDPARPNDYEDYCQERELQSLHIESEPVGSQRSDSQSSSGGNGGSFAERMMKKMGWVEGQGLGKLQQGITSPLLAKKTTGRSGIIVGPKNERDDGESEHPHKKQATGSSRSSPSRIVLLRNMVGPGEVDSDLEGETGTECTKYGEVEKVSIFEVDDPAVPDDQAVRIFVCFRKTEDATKALSDLNGRYFGGRIVMASYYDGDKYNHKEWGPEYDSE